MYNWDDPINDALSKPDIVPEKKVAPEISTDSSQASADVENFPTSKDNGIQQDVIYIRYDEQNMKFMYMCSHCKYCWEP